MARIGALDLNVEFHELIIKPPLQLSVGTPKIGYLVVERRGHVLLRRALLAAS
jgi:hypothetical protein